MISFCFCFPLFFFLIERVWLCPGVRLPANRLLGRTETSSVANRADERETEEFRERSDRGGALRLIRARREPVRKFLLDSSQRTESRENWTPAQNGRLDRVGSGDPTPTPACFAFALLAFSFACVNTQAVNSLLPVQEPNENTN